MPRHLDAPYRVRRTITQLNERGVKLPDSVHTALGVLDRVEAEIPAEPAHHGLRDAVLADEPPIELDRLLLAELGTTRLRTAYTQAAQVAATRVLDAILGASNEIHPQLAEHADRAIDTLQTAAGVDVTLDALVRSGRHAEARAAADVDLAGADLAALYQLRDEALTPGGPAALRVGGAVNCSVWRDPRVVDHHQHGPTAGQRFITGLRAGGQLWYPDAADAIAAAEPIYAELQAEAEAAADRRRQLGGITAWA